MAMLRATSVPTASTYLLTGEPLQTAAFGFVKRSMESSQSTQCRPSI
jgi:hypothetical protein